MEQLFKFRNEKLVATFLADAPVQPNFLDWPAKNQDQVSQALAEAEHRDGKSYSISRILCIPDPDWEPGTVLHWQITVEAETGLNIVRQ